MLNLNHNDILLNIKRFKKKEFLENNNLLFIPLLFCGEFEGDDDNVELAAGGGGESEERLRISTAFVCTTH